MPQFLQSLLITSAEQVDKVCNVCSEINVEIEIDMLSFGRYGYCFFFSPTQLQHFSLRQTCRSKLMQCADKNTGQNSPLPPITVHYVRKMWSVYSSLDM